MLISYSAMYVLSFIDSNLMQCSVRGGAQMLYPGSTSDGSSPAICKSYISICMYTLLQLKHDLIVEFEHNLCIINVW